jgi:hypothetical protein
VAAFLGIFRKKTIPRLKFAREAADRDDCTANIQVEQSRTALEIATVRDGANIDRNSNLRNDL